MKPDKVTYPSEAIDLFNPLLYYKDYVSSPVKPTAEARLLAEDYALFVLKPEMIQKAKENIPLFRSPDFMKQNPVVVARTIRHWLASEIVYDDSHTLQGIRSTVGTWEDQKGHCMEKNSLYYAFLRYAGINTEWHVAKNPISYKFSGAFDVGHHPFLRFRYQGATYFADFACGPQQRESLVGLCATSAPFSELEMISFLVGEGGEDLAVKGHYQKAEYSFRDALKIDPNNYVHHVSLAVLCGLRNDEEGARKEFARARSIAPRCGDIDKSEGDFNLDIGDEAGAVSSYQRAIHKQSRDAFLFLDAARRLHAIGAPKTAKQAEEHFVKLAKREGITQYLKIMFDHESEGYRHRTECQKRRRQIEIFNSMKPAYVLLKSPIAIKMSIREHMEAIRKARRKSNR